MLNYQTKVGKITLVTGWPFGKTVSLSYRWSGCLSDADIYNITTKQWLGPFGEFYIFPMVTKADSNKGVNQRGSQSSG